MNKPYVPTVEQIPQDFLLVRVNASTKRPIEPMWQIHPKTFENLGHQEGESVGLLLDQRNQVMALDVDEYDGYLEGKELPETFSVTSGRAGRRCWFFRMPDGDYRHSTLKNPENPEEKVEFRYHGKQQVIFGIHPETKQPYKWIGNPDTIAPAPQWVLDQMVGPPKLPVVRKKDKVLEEDTWLEVVKARKALKDAEKIYDRNDYDTWIKVGMALKTVSPELFADWVAWSEKADDPRKRASYSELQYHWDSFSSSTEGGNVTLGTLIADAREARAEVEAPPEPEQEPEILEEEPDEPLDASELFDDEDESEPQAPVEPTQDEDVVEVLEEGDDPMASRGLMSQIAWRYCWMATQNAFYDRVTKNFVTKEALKYTHGHRFYKDKDGEVHPVNAANYARQAGTHIDQLIYAPGRPKILKDTWWTGDRIQKRKGVTIFNTADPFPKPVDNPKGYEEWRDHIHKVYPDHSEYIFDWLAFTLQNPKVKINHALVMLGKMGIGKSAMFSPLSQMLGSQFGAAQLSEVISPFNGRAILGHKLLVLDEPEHGISGKGKLANTQLKNLLAAPPHGIKINMKNVKTFTTPNICSVVITANDIHSLKIERDDRRYYICYTDMQPQTKEYYKFIDRIDARGVYSWLCHRDVSNFNPQAKPPITGAAKMVMMATEDPLYTMATDVLMDMEARAQKVHGSWEEDIHPKAFFRTTFDRALEAYLMDTGDIDSPTTQQMTKVLLRMAFLRSDHRHRFKDIHGKEQRSHIFHRLACKDIRAEAQRCEVPGTSELT